MKTLAIKVECVGGASGAMHTFSAAVTTGTAMVMTTVSVKAENSAKCTNTHIHIIYNIQNICTHTSVCAYICCFLYVHEMLVLECLHCRAGGGRRWVMDDV